MREVGGISRKFQGEKERIPRYFDEALTRSKYSVAQVLIRRKTRTLRSFEEKKNLEATPDCVLQIQRGISETSVTLYRVKSSLAAIKVKVESLLKWKFNSKLIKLVSSYILTSSYTISSYEEVSLNYQLYIWNYLRKLWSNYALYCFTESLQKLQLYQLTITFFRRENPRQERRIFRRSRSSLASTTIISSESQ